MRAVKDFDISDIKFKWVKKYDWKTKTTKLYIDCANAFDIETTSTETRQGEKFAFMYEFTIGIHDTDHIFYGRTWEEFMVVCTILHDTLNLSQDRILIIYVHNLSFEFQFMRKYFDFSEVFSVDLRKPIKATTSIGIEFRDSYILSGLSLSKTADNLVSHKIQKLTGDLDYTKIRTSKTYLTPQELAYCNNDVEILIDYIDEQIEQYGSITNIPLTNTGRVRRFVKQKCFHSKKSHKKESKYKRQRYMELMRELSLTLDDYIDNKKAFAGGFTHASSLYSNREEPLKNVSSIDFTSSYPTVLLSEFYPMGHAEITENESLESIIHSGNLYIIEIRLTGVSSKIYYESYLSASKCYDTAGVIENNGRIFLADTLTTTITNIDLEIILSVYKIQKIEILKCKKYYSTYLPKSIIESVLDLYEKKTTLKGVAGKEAEYLLNKGMLNSIYGMMVTDIIRPEIKYTDSWQESQELTIADMQNQIKQYNEKSSRFTFYTWGVFCTAYARRNLWLGNGEGTACILSMGRDYVYSDTDSIKFLQYENHKQEIERYNQTAERKLKDMCDYYKIDFSRCKPQTIKGESKLLGVWDYEGTYDRFKTLGAKRYMIEKNGKIEITVAGLGKKQGVEWLRQEYKTNDNIFKNFNNNLYVPAEGTGKNTHTYIDDVIEDDVVDYTGQKDHVISLSSVHLSGCDYTLSIAKQYGKFLKNLKEGVYAI